VKNFLNPERESCKLNPDNAMIKIDSLNKSFGHIKALNNLNLEIEKGELLGIIGPNGAGKTTTIVLLFILQPNSGEVTVGATASP
jgi:ABC-2 type transport system ATP-binding protein